MLPLRLIGASALVSCIFVPIVFGQMQDDVVPNAETLRAQVEALAQSRKQNKMAYLQKARGEVSNAVRVQGAAGNYIIDCMKVVQYEGKEGGNAEFAEWKKQNRNLFSNRDFERAADLHLRYLAITLKRAMADSAEPVQQDVWDYLAVLGQAKDLLADVVRDKQKLKFNIFDPKEQKVTGEIVGDIQNMQPASATNVRGYLQDLLNGGVNAGLAAQSLKLTGHLDGITDWELVPGNVSGIFEQDIRSFLREKKDPRLISTWDYEISFRGEVMALKKDEREAEKFQRVEVPRLLWKKAADVELLGYPNRALGIRLEIVKKYPEHPDFEAWADKVETEVKALEKEAKAKETPAPAPVDASMPTPSATQAP